MKYTQYKQRDSISPTSKEIEAAEDARILADLKAGAYWHMRLPAPAAPTDKQYAMPDPDVLRGAYERVRQGVYDTEDLKAVVLLAGGYLSLTTYELGQECCVGKLRDIWRARRKREGREV